MKKVFTQNRLKELLHYDQLTGIFTWCCAAGNAVKQGHKAGYLNSRGYIYIRIERKLYLAHRLAILYVDGYLPEGDVDHEDQVKYHNWYSNLRPETTRVCNMRNTGNPSHNKSGVKGVSWSQRDSVWFAALKVNYKQIALGTYKSFTRAVWARYQKELELNWAGCDSTSPAFLYLKKLGHI